MVVGATVNGGEGLAMSIVTEGTDRPWGVGSLSWSTASTDVVRLALEYRPAAVMLSFGDPTLHEAGGNGGRRATLPFVPIVVELAGATPVLAAGGIAGGRGLAAALSLGAAGALLGTRFQASLEALVDPRVAAPDRREREGARADIPTTRRVQ